MLASFDLKGNYIVNQEIKIIFTDYFIVNLKRDIELTFEWNIFLLKHFLQRNLIILFFQSWT